MPFCKQANHAANVTNGTSIVLGDKQQLPAVLKITPNSPIWSSKQGKVDEDTGFMPTSQRTEHTIIMALRFPSKADQQPSIAYVPGYKEDNWQKIVQIEAEKQWILLYGGDNTGSQHWIWQGGINTVSQGSTAVFKNNVWQIGVYNGLQIQKCSVNGQDDIVGGEVLTFCTVIQDDGEYTLYVNGTACSTLTTTSETNSVTAYFDYHSSRITTQTVPYRSTWDFGDEFKGTIHETRVYTSSLTSLQVREITNELNSLYK
jgi:hypothetical protein